MTDSMAHPSLRSKQNTSVARLHYTVVYLFKQMFTSMNISVKWQNYRIKVVEG